MTEQKQDIAIPGLPEGWRAVAYRRLENGDFYLNEQGEIVENYALTIFALIVEKCTELAPTIKPRRMTFEFVVEVTKDNTAYFSSEHGYVCFDNKWWRLVEEE